MQTFRQHYRGRLWVVFRDPSNNQFFRVDESAYRFVAMLDGQRTVAQVWEACNEQLGDAAPTQGEAIQLLGQLYTSNLIHADLPADAAGMFDRYKKRMNRQVRGYLMNVLFARVPIFDPDRMLDRW
ncbi:MAG: PqqD family peptide modification chaperone, partial [Deinococcota bacterium]